VTLPQTPTFKPHFRFESFWTLMPGFQETVSQAWNREVQPALNPSTTLHIKLSRTAKAPRSWSRSLIPQTKVASAVCREVIQQLESTQEQRQLNLEERQLISTLKNRLLGLAAIEKCRARQKSILTWLKKGDANTRYFQCMANVRKQRNFIHALQVQGSNYLATSENNKQKVIFDHFQKHLGSYVPRTYSLNFTGLNWQPRNLQHLDMPFSEHEVKTAIHLSPREKAPGPDGYIGLFFSSCWEIIRHDFMRAVEQFYLLNQQGLHFLNQALVVLIPKKYTPQTVTIIDQSTLPTALQR
jgi:hypothetical protein